MKLSKGKSIILFRFHNKPRIALERIKILRFLNPDCEIHILFGGAKDDARTCKEFVSKLVDSFWVYPKNQKRVWKWMHSDLMLKTWYREFGKDLKFDYLFSYEYDLLVLKPLVDAYPNIDTNTLALAACESFTRRIEDSWTWTSRKDLRPKYLKFVKYMKENFGLNRQKYVCLGPGPLLPRNFIEKYSRTKDVEFVHEELTYPAYAEALGFKLVNHGMHAGFGASEDEEKFFNCHNDMPVTKQMLFSEISKTNGVREFHPVKYLVTLKQIKSKLLQ